MVFEDQKDSLNIEAVYGNDEFLEVHHYCSILASIQELCYTTVHKINTGTHFYSDNNNYSGAIHLQK